MERLGIFWQFLADNRSKLLEQVLEHVGLTFLSLLLAAAVAIPLGIYITRHKRLAAGVLGVAGVLQTIPSIALLGFMIPLLGIGLKPAIFALFLYALLPIIRNTYTGIQEVDGAVKEAAMGMGLSKAQILRQVELPLALPVIFAGLRTATVINVGVAALAAYIGAGGLGEFIFGGIALNNSTMILAGAIPAALLAVLFDQLLALLQRSGRLQVLKAGRALLILIPLLSSSYFWPQAYGPGWTAGIDPEFIGRPDGYAHLADTYGISFNTTILSSALMYKAVSRGDVDLIVGYSTDGRIKAYQLAVLEDSRHAFPPYYCAPVIGAEVAEKHPEVAAALNLLAGRVSDSVMTELNYRADFGKESPQTIARDFLESLGLWRPDQAQGGERLDIGSKIFTEQYILVEIFSQMINGYTGLDTNLRPGLGGTKICFDALRAGEIALYPEYTGTGLLVLLDTPADTVEALIDNPDATYRYVRRAFDASYGIQWLEPLGFNNTYALMARQEMAKRLGLKDISQLKR